MKAASPHREKQSGLAVTSLRDFLKRQSSAFKNKNEVQFVLPPTECSQVAKRLISNRSAVSSKPMQPAERPILRCATTCSATPVLHKAVTLKKKFPTT